MLSDVLTSAAPRKYACRALVHATPTHPRPPTFPSTSPLREPVLKILMVCTGNICRSPLSALLLATRLRGLTVQIESAGTEARDGMPMTAQAVSLGVEAGVPLLALTSHRSRSLSAAQVESADLVVAMTKSHRRAVVELSPAATRKAFTARELPRLLAAVDGTKLRAAGWADGSSAAESSERFAEMLNLIAANRGLIPPSPLHDDDVVDPYGRSDATYRQSLAEMAPAVEATDQIIRAVINRG